MNTLLIYPLKRQCTTTPVS